MAKRKSRKGLVSEGSFLVKKINDGIKEVIKVL